MSDSMAKDKKNKNMIFIGIIAVIIVVILFLANASQQPKPQNIAINSVEWEAPFSLMSYDESRSAVPGIWQGILIFVNDPFNVEKIYVDDILIEKPNGFPIINGKLSIKTLSDKRGFKIEENHQIKVCGKDNCDTKQLNYLSKPTINIKYMGGLDNQSVDIIEFEGVPSKICGAGFFWIRDDSGWKSSATVNFCQPGYTCTKPDTCGVFRENIYGKLKEVLAIDAGTSNIPEWGRLTL